MALSPRERQELLQELEYIKILLDFHVQNQERIAMTEEQFEEYVNAALDSIIEIRKQLNDEHDQTSNRT